MNCNRCNRPIDDTEEGEACITIDSKDYCLDCAHIKIDELEEEDAKQHEEIGEPEVEVFYPDKVSNVQGGSGKRRKGSHAVDSL